MRKWMRQNPNVAGIFLALMGGIVALCIMGVWDIVRKGTFSPETFPLALLIVACIVAFFIRFEVGKAIKGAAKSFTTSRGVRKV